MTVGSVCPNRQCTLESGARQERLRPSEGGAQTVACGERRGDGGCRGVGDDSVDGPVFQAEVSVTGEYLC